MRYRDLEIKVQKMCNSEARTAQVLIIKTELGGIFPYLSKKGTLEYHVNSK